MDWTAIGVLAEIIAAVAVVTSVVYLAVQIRASMKQSQAQSHSTMVTDLGPFLQWQIENREFAEVFRKGLLDYSSLDATDRLRLSHAFYHLLMGFKDTLEAYERGLLGVEDYKAWERYVAAYLKMPGGGIWWSEARESWVPKVQQRIDEALSKARPVNELMPTIWDAKKTEGDAQVNN